MFVWFVSVTPVSEDTHIYKTGLLRFALLSFIYLKNFSMSLEKAAGSKTFLNSYDSDDSLETYNKLQSDFDVKLGFGSQIFTVLCCFVQKKLNKCFCLYN